MDDEKTDPWRASMDARIGHLDATFSSSIDRIAMNQADMAQEVASSRAILNNVVATLETLSKRINEPNHTNWWGMISAVVAVVALLGVGITMKVSPIEARQYQLGTEIAANTDLLANRGIEMGKQYALQEVTTRQVSELWNTSQDYQSQMGVLRERTAGIEAAVSELRRDVIEVDRYGSRAWVNQNPKP